MNLWGRLKTPEKYNSLSPEFPVGKTRSFSVWKVAPFLGDIWMFPKIVVPPNHPFFIGFSIINHPFWGTIIIVGNPHLILFVKVFRFVFGFVGRGALISPVLSLARGVGSRVSLPSGENFPSLNFVG